MEQVTFAIIKKNNLSAACGRTFRFGEPHAALFKFAFGFGQ